jgi:tetratricopeptide (TPR) repeat protein
MGTVRQRMSWMGLATLVVFAGLTLPWSVQAFSDQELAREKGRETVQQDVSNQSVEMAANNPVDRRLTDPVRGPDGGDVVRRRAEQSPGTVYLGQARKWRTETEELPVIHRHLARELVRQAFLLAARDELGLATADAWLGDVMPDSGVFDIAMTPGDPLLLEVSRRSETTRLEFAGHKHRRASPTDYGTWTKEAEVLSRMTFPEVLKKAGFRSRSKVRKSNAEVPASVETLLGEMNVVAQFRALREMNALIRSEGESPALLGALVRGYANLGVMTEYYWHPAHKVFKARALLYAQRMVAQDENLPIAKWHRAYAAALAGLHAWALADLDAAGKSAAELAGKNRAMAPAWSQLIGPFCRYEVEAIGKYTKDPKIGQLAALLKYLAVEQAGGQRWIVQTATSVLPVIPECYRVHDGLADLGGVSVEDSVTAAPIRLAGETLYARLKSISGLPAEAKRIVGTRATNAIWQSIIEKTVLSNAVSEYEARHRLVEALFTRDEPGVGSDVGEPSWSTLGLMLREMSFMQVYRRMGFVRFNYPGSCEQWLSDSASLVRGHPCEALLGTFSIDINKVQNAARRIARLDLAGGDYPPRHFGAVLLSREGKLTSSSMLERPSWNRDDVVRDSITYIRWYADSRADPGKQTLDTLLKISPYSPFARAQLVVFHWNEVQDKVAQWDKESAVYPGLSVALAMRYMGLGRWDDTRRCLKAAIQIVPCDLILYRQLAAVYKRQGQTDRWLATLEEGLKQHTFGLGRSDVQSEIAYHYMYKKQWEKALPYAEGAAASGSSSGLVCAAECNEALQRWTEAEKYWRTSTERYMGFFTNWYAFCRRTGKGDVKRARIIAQNIVDRLAANAYIPNSCGVDRWDAILFYLLEDQPENALAEIERVVERKPDADDVLCMAVVADRLNNTRKRDEALNRAKLLSGHDGNDPDPRPNGIVTLAEAFAKDLAAGGKGKMDFVALDKVDRALSGSERFSFDAVLAEYLEFHGQPAAAQRYALRCMGWPKMGVRYRTLAGAMLVRQKIDPASYRAMVLPEPGKDSQQPVESSSRQSDLSWTRPRLEGTASNSGGFSLDKSKLRALFPNVDWTADQIAHLSEHLRLGDTRAAIVASVRPLVISAYSDELDAVILVQFPDVLVSQYALAAGDRLVVSWIYPKRHQTPNDVVLGEHNLRRYDNGAPLVAEFFSNSVDKIKKRKSDVSAAEWERIKILTPAALKRADGKYRSCFPLATGQAPGIRDAPPVQK